ncbi:hypothetical protein [Leclercia adecarboxylata]|uniref:hypothetical protein n=1 Tax=Leclercia adecarboxylata TaxID=83655 RepID=UPI0011DF8C77|nr:hypothetical protein [Leclercia adecarboxylata]NEG91051.1 hypothetical protein [Leclercia adecarboxylata]
MTTNKQMTGEQLDELMAVAVRIQRDGEVAHDFPSANFAYAVQVAVLELRRTRDIAAALAAENAALKSGASYFSYGSEHNFEWHKTAAEAVEAAESAIDDYRGDACDGWSEEVDSVCWGIIMQSSMKVGERPRNDEDCCDPAIDTICDYALLPNIETPATDAFLAEVRAQGVDAAIEHLTKKFEGTGQIGVPVMALEWLAKEIRQDANTAELVAAGIITRVECVGGKCE